MKPIVVSDVLAVGEFPTLEQLEILAKAGFKSVINNQPDGEVERFPASTALAAEAERLGLRHAYVPIETRVPEPEALERLAAAVATLPDPIFAFCYSGARSAAACAFLRTETEDVPKIVADFAEGGFDVSALVPWLDEARAHHLAAGRAAANAAGGNGHAGIGHAGNELAGNGAAAGNGAVIAGPPDALPPGAVIAGPPAAVTPVAVTPAAVTPAITAAARAAEAPIAAPTIVYPRAAGFGGFAI